MKKFIITILTLITINLNAKVVVLIHGWMGNFNSWENSKVIKKLKKADWTRGGILFNSKNKGVRIVNQNIRKSKKIFYTVNIPSRSSIYNQTENHLKPILNKIVKFHSNEDIMTVLYFLDDVTLENGPLEVVPGTHIGPLHSHWQDGVFTGAVDDKVAESNRGKAVSCLGKAGSACLMHSKLLHGSASNRSLLPRSLFIITYKAEDAVALSPNHLPSDLVGMVVRGKKTGTVRCTSYSVELPEYPKEVSFFGQQSKSKNFAM